MSNVFRNFVIIIFLNLIVSFLFAQKGLPINLDSLKSSGGISRNGTPRESNTFEYENICGCKGTIQLNIYKGLDDPSHNWGGNLVPNRDKSKLGSVTVANKNDTDGDSIIDNIDTVVRATAYGVDELDLMKLEIVADGKFAPNCNKIKLKNLSTNPSVRFWRNATKEVPYNINQIIELQPVTIKKYRNEVVLTIWVEVGEVSTMLRDVKINAIRLEKDTTTGITYEAPKDSVTATAIWVTKKNVYVSDSTKITLPDPSILGIDDLGLLETIEKDAIQSNYGCRSMDNTRYGFGSYRKNKSKYYTGEDLQLGGRILFEFEIFPHDIVKEMNQQDITFDIGRRKNVRDFSYSYGYQIPDSTIEVAPKLLDIANDDPQDTSINKDFGDFIDEDNIPKNFEIYSFDGPSTRRTSFFKEVTHAFILRDVKFEEFVRTSFNNINLKGDSTLNGSRCSNKIDWFINYASSTNKSFNNSNQYNPYYQYCENVKANVRVVTLPRISMDTITQDCVFDIKSLSNNSSNRAYSLIYSKVDSSFSLEIKNATDTKWNSIAMVKKSNGNWTLKFPLVTPEIRVDIYPGLLDFYDKERFYFWIKDIPSNIINKINSK